MLSHRRARLTCVGAIIFVVAVPGLPLGEGRSDFWRTAAVTGGHVGIHPAIAFGVPGDPFEPARAAGVTWTRNANSPDIFWAVVDPDRTGEPSLMHYAGTTIGPGGTPIAFDYDACIAQALASGLSVMWNIAVEPAEWGYSRYASWLPTDVRAYRRFVQTTIRRYPGVRVWQVGNEPDIQLGFPPPLPRRADFAKLQRLTYEAIKDVDPGVVVIMGGAADWNLGYFDAVLDELDGCCVDVFDFHNYGDPRGGTLMRPPLPPVGYQHIETQARSIRKHLDDRGFSRTRIWSTECGTFSGTVGQGPATMTATEAEQARDLVKRFVAGFAAGVERIFWAYGISEGFGSWEDPDYFDHTGLIYTGHGAPPGTRKLGYWALWQLTRRIESCRFDRVEQQATRVPFTRAYRFTIPSGGSIVIAWWDTFFVPGYQPGDTISLTLPWSGPNAIARPAIPARARGANVDPDDPAAAFPATRLTPERGSIRLVLGPDPVWITVD
ncbi:MAG: hypothetical protein HYX75_10430 [Acidobacteria bacterium]|nr:hypothetical protein [Acidobacteriota bacterium]